MKKIILFLVLISFNAYSSEWSEYEAIESSKLSITIDQNLKSIIGNIQVSAWISKAKFEGEKAFTIFVENFSDNGFLYLDHTKFPPTWLIRGSGNDKKYIVNKTAWLLNIDKSKNPISGLRKDQISRYRDIHNNVVPYVKFNFEDQNCVVFKKGYYTQESGYERAAEDDEILSGIYCDYSETRLSNNIIEQIIDGIEVKDRR